MLPIKDNFLKKFEKNPKKLYFLKFPLNFKKLNKK